MRVVTPVPTPVIRKVLAIMMYQLTAGCTA
jgi:hypothetical protein